MDENEKLANELLVAFLKIRKFTIKLEHDDGLTNQECMVLESILHGNANEKSATPNYLCSRLSISPEALSRSIRHLRQKGYVSTIHNPKERRRVIYVLKAKGEEACKLISDKVLSKAKEYVSMIGEEDTKHLLRILTKTFTNMELHFHNREENICSN